MHSPAPWRVQRFPLNTVHPALAAFDGGIWTRLRRNHAVRRLGHRTIRCASGDDVGEQPVFEGNDPVLDRELALFQPLDLQLISMGRRLERDDLLIEFPVFGDELRQLLAQIDIGRRQLHGAERLSASRAGLKIPHDIMISPGRYKGFLAVGAAKFMRPDTSFRVVFAIVSELQRGLKRSAIISTLPIDDLIEEGWTAGPAHVTILSSTLTGRA